jgi:competence protein ComGC
MRGQYVAMLIVIFVVMILVNTINVTAQSQNITNETGIGENQSISGRISGFGGDLDFGPRVVDEPPK